MGDATPLADVLVKLSHLVERVFVDAGRHHGLTSQQIHLLCILTAQPVGMTELGRLLDLGKSGLTGLVDRVERRGLTTRVRDAADRRAWKVALTDEGTRLATAAHDLVTAQLETLGGLRPQARAEAAALLAGLLDEPRLPHDPHERAATAAPR
jgi:DNA-binding MarR family transcriptional regulator